MIILLWNCSVEGSKDFQLHFKDLTHKHKPDIPILIETKLSSERASEVIPQLGFKNFITSAAEGLSKGIVVMWNNDLDLEIGRLNQSRSTHLCEG